MGILSFMLDTLKFLLKPFYWLTTQFSQLKHEAKLRSDYKKWYKKENARYRRNNKLNNEL